MACRCQERRNAIRKASQAKTAAAVVEAAKFVATTLVQDAAKVVDIRRKVR